MSPGDEDRSAPAPEAAGPSDPAEAPAPAGDGAADQGAERAEVKALLDAFAAGLAAQDEDLEGLEAGAGAAAIAAAEDALGLELPQSYRAFLRRWNGGSAYDTSIYGVGCEEGFDLAQLNLRGRAEGLPAHLVGFAATVTGDVFCFDTSQADEKGEYAVSLIDIEEGQVLPAAKSFLEFLERLPTLEQELAKARGPQVMTVDEWESFLQREREKLRHLSKTPARDLTMPDPEKVRADLGGKIPVDPRHLKPRS